MQKIHKQKKLFTGNIKITEMSSALLKKANQIITMNFSEPNNIINTWTG